MVQKIIDLYFWKRLSGASLLQFVPDLWKKETARNCPTVFVYLLLFASASYSRDSIDKKKDATQILPQKIPSAHPYESLETHPLQQKLYTPAFAKLSAEEVIRSLFTAVEPELLQERLFVHRHYELISEVNYILKGIPDDSVAGDKTVLPLVRVNEQWELLAARSSHKCYQDRGISDWNTQPCLWL